MASDTAGARGCGSRVMGITGDFLSLIERGINAPSSETIEQMARRLRVPVKALFVSLRDALPSRYI